MSIIKDIFRKNEYKLVDYSIQDGEKHRVAIIIPGGAYSFVADSLTGRPIAQKLNEKGISCFVLYYRVRSKAQFPNPQDDLAKAIVEIMSMSNELNLDMSNYSVWGASAGGHLAASFGLESIGYAKYNLPKPKMIELTYPVITMDRKLSHKETRKWILGKDTSKEDLLSIDKQITANYPSTFIWCGNADKTVSPENTHLMVNSLKANSINHQFFEFDDVGHGVGVGEGTNAEGWIEKAIEFWNSL